MADIFISYARADRGKIEKLAAALEGEGYSVWWDRQIVGGAEFSKDIESAIKDARAVIVAWSASSIESHWVRDEAVYARDHQKMIPIQLDETEPPMGFRQVQAVEFASDQGAALDALKRSLAVRLGDQQSDDDAAPVAQAAAAKIKVSDPRVIGGALAALFILVGFVFLLRSVGNNEPIANPSEAAQSAPEASIPITAASDVRAPEKSIAVLPFVAFSLKQDDAFFGKGVAEELLNALAQFPDLKVAARTSAFSFEGKNADLRVVGETLGVAHVLEGSLRRSGERLRITAQLIRVSDGFHLWSETYERELTDIFEIQDEIVTELARILQFRLGVGAGAGRAAGDNVDPRAYEEYLRGLDMWWRREDNQSRIDAILAFRKATTIDPSFADGWSAYAVSLALSGADNTPFLSNNKKFAAETRKALSKALEIDPDNVRALAGEIIFAVAARANENRLDRLMTAAPNAAIVNYAAAQHYYFTGQFEPMTVAFDGAMALDPLNETVGRVRAVAFGATGKYELVADGLKRRSICPDAGCAYKHPLAAYFGLISAIMTEDATEIRFWRDRFVETRYGFASDPASDHFAREEIVVKFANEILAGEPDNDYWRDMDAIPVKLGTGPFFWAAIFAQRGHVELALDTLLQFEAGSFGLINETENFFPFLDGPLEFPEDMRRHPKFHALFEQAGMAELAEARRTNGQPYGLPLPIDGGGE